MTISSVFRGPGNRLVAISHTPGSRGWVVRQGEEGKRLRLSTVPPGDDLTFEVLRQRLAPNGYTFVHEGKIDSLGKLVEPSKDMVYWEALNVEPAQLRSKLEAFSNKYRSLGGVIEITDDMTGYTASIQGVRFGLSRQPHIGLISNDGTGAGEVSTTRAPDAGTLIAYLATTQEPIKISDSDGNLIPTNRALLRLSVNATDAMSETLCSFGFEPMAATLKRLGQNPVTF